MRLQPLLIGLIFCFFSGVAVEATNKLSDWIPEDSSGEVCITCMGDTMKSAIVLSLFWRTVSTIVLVI